MFDETLETVPEAFKKKKKEKTTHIAIHTLHIDGLRELYRHFLALPNGAIVEVCAEHLNSYFKTYSILDSYCERESCNFTGYNFPAGIW